MVLKPLNNDDIEVSGTDKWGFLSPYYLGRFIFLSKRIFLTSLCFFSPQISSSKIDNLYSSLAFRQRFSRLLGSSFCAMEYKLAMWYVFEIQHLYTGRFFIIWSAYPTYNLVVYWNRKLPLRRRRLLCLIQMNYQLHLGTFCLQII